MSVTDFGAVRSGSWVICNFLIQEQNSVCLSLETLLVSLESGSTSLPSQKSCYKTISAHSQTHRKNIFLLWLIQSACDPVHLRSLKMTAEWIILSSDLLARDFCMSAATRSSGLTSPRGHRAAASSRSRGPRYRCAISHWNTSLVSKVWAQDLRMLSFSSFPSVSQKQTNALDAQPRAASK